MRLNHYILLTMVQELLLLSMHPHENPSIQTTHSAETCKEL